MCIRDRINPAVPATCFPTAAAMANSWDEELEQRVGVALGEESMEEDVNEMCIRDRERILYSVEVSDAFYLLQGLFVLKIWNFKHALVCHVSRSLDSAAGRSIY